MDEDTIATLPLVSRDVSNGISNMMKIDDYIWWDKWSAKLSVWKGLSAGLPLSKSYD